MITKYTAEAVLLFFTLCGVILYGIGYSDIIRLTPVYIVMNLVLLVATFRSRAVVHMLGIAFVIGFFAEAIGVHTGLLFGDYQYGNILGPKLIDVPLIVGMLWGLVMIALWSVFDKFSGSKKILLVALGAVVYDITLEHFAVRFGLWNWQGGIPLSNALGWLCIATLIGFVYDRLHIRLPKNALAWLILPIHTLFFVALMIMS